MTKLFKKLNLKNQNKIVVLQHPPSFEKELNAVKDFTEVDTHLDSTVDFILAFVQTQKEIESISAQAAGKLEGDGILWFAYPKKSSKKYSVEINRDSGWATLGQLGFEGVRAVSIDEDWSALRFRRVQYIKTLKRSSRMALSEEGKERTSNKKET